MSKEELIEFLREELSVDIGYEWENRGKYLKITINLEDEKICSDSIFIEESEEY